MMLLSLNCVAKGVLTSRSNRDPKLQGFILGIKQNIISFCNI